MRLHDGAFLLLLVVVASGCSKELNPDYRVPPPAVEPLPIRVGVYYDDRLRDFRVENQPPVEVDFEIRIGRANVSLYDNLLSEVFVEVVPLASRLQAPASGERLDAILEPEISSATYAFDVLRGVLFVEIDYAYTLYSPAGERLEQWLAKGRGRVSGGMGVYDMLDDGVDLAMRDAAARFVVALYTHPAIRRCLEQFPTPASMEGRFRECFAER